MKDSDQQQPSQKWQELQAKFRALCDEQEKIYQPQFEAIFTALYEIDEGQRAIYNTNGWNMGQPLPDKADEGLIAKAINKAGFAKKKTIAEGFLRYANTVIEGKRLQVEMALQNAKELTPPQPAVVAGWVFKPFANIIAPVELHSTINKVVADEALKGAFDSTTGIADESIDVLLDELMMAEAFNIPCSLTHYTEELKRYNVILGQNSFFDRDCTRLLLATLKEAVLSLKEYTDKPNRLKKAIADIVKRFDDVKVWGIFFQILVLQGLCDMLERLDINEGESGYDEAQAFYKWLIEELCKKGWWFACVSSIAYGDGDLLRLEPLCAYLMSTTAGQLVQKSLKEPQQEPQRQPLKSFNGNRTEQQYTDIFNGLKGGYLPADGNLQGWLWVCAGTMGTQPTEPLKWFGTPTELALMVGYVFGTKWAVTEADFLYKSDSGEWKQPTQGYLSKQWKNSTIKGTKLEEILLPILNNVEGNE